MSSVDLVDTISIFFYADWCTPCQRVKPLYFQKIKKIYTMNGISTFEYNYDTEETKKFMAYYGVKTIPTLCVIDLYKANCTPHTIQHEDIIRIHSMNSQGIENDWDSVLLSFSTEEDF